MQEQHKSQSEQSSQSEVLIVGAGPTGLTLANDLLSRGVKFKIIDKSPQATTVSKAIVVHARTLEHLANLGFTDDFIAHGLPLRGSNVYAGGKRIVHLDLDEIDSPYKFILSIPQSETERILADNLTCADIAIDRNCELVSFTQDNQGVVARLRRTTSGGATSETEAQVEEFEHRCLYLVGCDGAHSTVRHQVGLSFDGAPYADGFGAADVKIECDLKDNEMHAYFSEEGALILVPFGDDRWRIIFESDDSAKINSGEPLEFQTVVDTVTRRIGKALTKLKISDPRWLAWFKIHRRCAPTYQVGRAFLVGDAGHVHSPIGGVGMNTGMQDAFNLGWKLGLACRGLAGEGLLESYTEERHAIGVAVLKGTDLATKVVTLKSPIAQAVRNGLMSFMSAQEVVQQRIIKAGSLTGVNYRGMRLSQESAQPQVESISRSLFPLPFKKVTGELPKLGSWLDFTDAPMAGDFAPDAELDDGGFRLSHHIGSPRFKLLLFDGYESTEQGYQQMYQLEYKVASRFCDWIDIYVVVPFAEGTRTLPNYASVIFDDQKYLHEYYGASSECLYLIRPDGYIGFRSQPASYEKLEEYLLRIFKPTLVQTPTQAKPV
ncbi:MAG: FAD-dependent monooxygenase [Cyanobacteria bacterium SZAS LIN-3]|nr:FAD-dependent monooxygenase [Cyanobacteria bacterium SZAS LIN-3]